MKTYAMEKNRNPGNRQMNLFRTVWALLILLAGLAGAPGDGIAKLTEPDVVYYGTVTGGIAGSFIKLKLDADSTTLATAAVGSDTGFVLRVPMDVVDPRVAGTARSGDKVTIYLGDKAIRSVVIPERGSMVNLPLTDTALTRADWDKLHPGDDGSGDMNRNGISDLQEFLNGNDPAACIWKIVDDSNAETTIYNAGVFQNCLTEAQSDGRHNLLKIATGTYFGNFTYAAADSEEFDLRIIGGYDPGGSGVRLTSEPEKTVLVGDKDANESREGRVLDIVAGPGTTSSTVRIEGFRIMYGGMNWNVATDWNATSGLHGGGLQVQTARADVELAGNIFSDNVAFKGGAVAITSTGAGSVLLVNNIIVNNAGFLNGAAAISSTGSGSVTLLNNTVADNWAENEGSGDSLLVESASAPVTLVNNIIRGVFDSLWLSDTSIKTVNGGTFPLTVHNNIMHESHAFETDIPGFTVDASNLTAEPLYLLKLSNYYSPTDGNYRLRRTSPGINSGSASPLLPSTDPDGRQRLIGSAVDIGAYELPETDDAYYLNPQRPLDPVRHTIIVADGADGHKYSTNKADLTFKGHISSPFTVTALSVGSTSEPIPLLNPDNSFEYKLALEPGSTWVDFEVTKADNVKIRIWYLFTLDTAAPTVTLSSAAPVATNVSPIPVQVTFDKDVTGFAAADIVVANGSVTPASFLGSKGEYSFTVTPAANGSVAVSVPANVVLDAAGNSNPASARLDRVYDTVAPGIILTSSLPGATYVTPIPVTVAFSETVTSLAAASLVVKNGTVSSYTATGSGYTFNVTPGGLNVQVTVDIAAGAVRDTAGNASTAATQLVRQYAPPIVIMPNLPKTTVSVPGGSFNKSFTLTMTATDNADIYYTLDGSAPSTASKRYATPLAIDKTTTLCYFAMDVAGNREDTATLAYVIDNEPPMLTISALADGKATNNTTLNVAGMVSDNNGIRELRINGSSVTVNSDGSFSSALTLTAGANRIVTTAIDLAGNETGDIRSISLDQHITALVVVSPADNSKSAVATSAISGSTEENAVIAIRVNGQTGDLVTMNGTGFAGLARLNVGLNTIEIAATNPAGTVTTFKRSVFYDNQNPTLAITEPGQDMQTSRSSILLKGRVTDSQTGVTVTVNDVPVTIASDGSFERLIEFSGQQSYSILVKAKDEANNETTVQRNVIYDTTVPTFTVPVQTPTNDGSQIITGSREAGTTIVVVCPTATVGTVTYPAADTWSVVLSSFAIGNNRITVTGTDAAGNGAVQNVDVSVGNIYNGPKTITFNAPTGMDIYYTLDGTAPTLGSGKYTGPLLVKETTTFRYFAVDSLGNTSLVTTVAYTIDTQAPVLTIVAPADNASTYDSPFAVSGTVTDNTRVQSLTINDAAVPLAANGSFSTAVTLLGGASIITTVATDIVGNRSTDIRTINLLKDVINPALLVSTLSSTAVTTHAILNVAGTAGDSESGMRSLTVNGLAAAIADDGTFTVPTTLAEGANTISTVATDNGGNSTTDTRTVNLDHTAPGFTVTTPADNSSTGRSPIAVSGRVDSPGVTVTARVNNGSPVAATMDGTNFTVTLAMASGLNTIEITAAAQGRNSGSAKRSITFSAAGPTLSISDPAQDTSTVRNSVTINGTLTDAAAGATIGVAAAGQSYTPAVASDGSFSQVVTLTENVVHTVVVTARDQTGVLATVRRNIIKRANHATGDINEDGTVDISDALKVLRIAVGLESAMAGHYATADVAPFINGSPAPDGVIDIADALVILDKAVGFKSW